MTALRSTVRDGEPIQKAAAAMGAVFLLVAVAGFVPGLTSDYDRLGTFGDVAAKLLGVFGVNWLENLVHLTYAVAGFALARSVSGARTYFIGGGVLYGVVWIYGMVTGIHDDANILGVNDAGNWLHAALFVAMVAIGLALGKRAFSADPAGSGRRRKRPLRARGR